MLQREIDPAPAADIAKFEEQLERYLAGDLDEDVFRVFRLNNGIYGQRQGGHNQMVRVKVALRLDHRRAARHVRPTSPRRTPAAGATSPPARTSSSTSSTSSGSPKCSATWRRSGLTTREACGDTVRNVMGCHLAGACPFEVLDISPWAEAAFQHFLRNPLAQRLPRKFKINFSGCETDCGQAMFNDVGVIATTRTRDDGTVEAGFRVFVAGGLGANPHPALALEEFTAREDLLPTIESVLRVFEQTRQPRQQAAGPPEVARRHARLRGAAGAGSSSDPQASCSPRRRGPAASPRPSQKHGDAPAGRRPSASRPRRIGQGTPVALRRDRALRALGGRQRRARRRQGHRVGLRLRPPRRHHHRPVPGAGLDPARARRRGPDHQPPEPRLPRASSEDQLPTLYARLERHRHGRARAPSWPATSSPARAPTPATWPSPSRRGLADAIGAALEEEGLAEVGGVRTNISGCTNSLRPAPHRPTSASSAPSAGPTASRRPATRCCSAATSARRRSTSARRPCACRPRTPPRPWCGSSVASPTSARPARPSAAGSTAPAASKAIADDAAGPRRVPHARRGPRVLRRLRRDRPLRGRDRRIGVRDMSAHQRRRRPSSPTRSWPS